MPFILSDLENRDILVKKIEDLCKIVFSRHFYVNVNEKEDLLSVGMLKALDLLNSGYMDLSKGSMLNFLYTGIRNEMKNYLYRTTREVFYEDYYLEASLTSWEHDVDDDGQIFSVDFALISRVCRNFYFYGDLSRYVADKMTSMGFNIVNCTNCTNCYDNHNNSEETFIDNTDDLVSRLVGAVLWESKVQRSRMYT